MVRQFTSAQFDMYTNVTNCSRPYGMDMGVSIRQ